MKTELQITFYVNINYDIMFKYKNQFKKKTNLNTFSIRDANICESLPTCFVSFDSYLKNAKKKKISYLKLSTFVLQCKFFF